MPEVYTIVAKVSLVRLGREPIDAGLELFMISTRHKTLTPRDEDKLAMSVSSRPSLCIRTTVLAGPCLLLRPIPRSAAFAIFLSSVGPCKTIHRARSREPTDIQRLVYSF